MDTGNITLLDKASGEGATKCSIQHGSLFFSLCT